MIHQTAVIDPRAELGLNVTVGPFSYIEGDVRIGDGCVIGPHASILRYTTLGARCRVHDGAVLGDVPQDLGFKEARSEVRIGAGCVIREGVTVHRGTKPDTATEIGDGCFLMSNSHFAHNVKLGSGVIVANGTLLAGYVQVGDRAFISGNVVVHQFTRIGRLAMIGGAAGLSKDVPPFAMADPMSRNLIRATNVIGLRRAGFSPEDREQVRKAFKILYWSGLSFSDATDKLRAAFTAGPGMEIVAFVEQSRPMQICGFGGEADDA